jgi:hypothetical protein
VSFPNTTGSDIYYLNDIIPFHDGIRSSSASACGFSR